MAGLSAQEFADIHLAVAEARDYVDVPVVFYLPVPGAVDPLYGESVGGKEGWAVYANLRGSVKLSPSEETLTRFGLKANTEVLASISRQRVLEWEAETGQTLALTDKMHMEVYGQRYNVSECPPPNHLPVGDGTALDYIEIIVTGCTKQL